jgi:hypothetical protein
MSLLRTSDLRDLEAVDIAAAETLSVGGERWRVYRLSGAGVSTAKTRAPVGYVSGWLAQDEKARSAATDAGQPAASALWTFTRTGGVALVLGDELEGDGATCRLGALSDLVVSERWEATKL